MLLKKLPGVIRRVDDHHITIGIARVILQYGMPAIAETATGTAANGIAAIIGATIASVVVTGNQSTQRRARPVARAEILVDDSIAQTTFAHLRMHLQ